MANARAMQPVLTLVVLSHVRSDVLAPAIESMRAAVPNPGEAIELLISSSEPVADGSLAGWDGQSRHLRSAGGEVDRLNACIAAASGQWILMLHDDDRLLPGAVRSLLVAIATAQPDDRALLFGCRVVDGEGRLLRQQRFRHEILLDPAAALRRVLKRPSFVRLPAIVIRRDAYAAAGAFSDEAGGPIDLDMWIRVLALSGVRCFPAVTCEYTVDPGAPRLTSETVGHLEGIYRRAAGLGVLSAEQISRCQRDLLHEFILGAAVRSLRARDRATARDLLRLFEIPTVRKLGLSRRWMATRMAITALVGGTR